MNIRLIRYRNRCFWQAEGVLGWAIEPQRFIRAQLRGKGFTASAIDDFITQELPVDAVPRILLTQLVRRGKTIGYQIGTWIGPQVASATEIRQFLRRNWYSAEEVESLFSVADAAELTSSQAKQFKKRKLLRPL